MKDLVYKNGQGFVALCAVNDLASVEKIVESIRKCLKNKKLDVVPLVVGINKMDLDEKEHVVTQEIVKKAFKEIGVTNLSIFNTSAKTSENIEPCSMIWLGNVELVHMMYLKFYKKLLRRMLES